MEVDSLLIVWWLQDTLIAEECARRFANELYGLAPVPVAFENRTVGQFRLGKLQVSLVRLVQL